MYKAGDFVNKKRIYCKLSFKDFLNFFRGNLLFFSNFFGSLNKSPHICVIKRV